METKILSFVYQDDVTKYLTWPTHSNMDGTRRVVGIWIKEYDNPSNYQWCIELKETNEAIGSISVVSLNENVNAVEVGYCIGKKFWGQGITTEAFKALIAFFFKELPALLAYVTGTQAPGQRAKDKGRNQPRFFVRASMISIYISEE